MRIAFYLLAIAASALLVAVNNADSLPPRVQYILAGTYHHIGQRMHGKATSLARQAAEQGHMESYIRLGWMHLNQNKERTVQTWRTAAEQGYAPAQYLLGTFGTPVLSREESLQWLTRAAEQGHAPAQYSLAYLYQGTRWVPLDFDQSVHWLRKAAAQDHKEAVRSLRFMEEHGYLDE